MNKQLVIDVATECTKRGNMAQKLNRALQMQLGMRREGMDFATMADIFAIVASWEGHRVFVDDVQWIPPILPETDGGVQ